MNMESEQQLLYISTASEGIGESDVGEIFHRSTFRNANSSVSGKLFFSGVHFAQVLEGGAVALKGLMKSIRADSRHSNVRILLWEDAANRAFEGWSLNYLNDLGSCDLLGELSAASHIPRERAARLVEHLFRPPGIAVGKS